MNNQLFHSSFRSEIACCFFAAMVLFTSCKPDPIPPEINAHLQLLELSFDQPDAGVSFQYDEQHRLAIIDGRFPGQPSVSLEVGYENEKSWIGRWVYTSDTDQYLANWIRVEPFWDGSSTVISLSPGLKDPYAYEESWRIWKRSDAAFPDSVEWNDGSFNIDLRRLYFDWNDSTRILSIEQRPRIFTQSGWIYVASDTSYAVTFDRSHNPFQGLALIRGVEDLVTFLAPNNVTSFQTNWPDSTWTRTRSYEYDAQGRPEQATYDLGGTRLTETRLYRQ